MKMDFIKSIASNTRARQIVILLAFLVRLSYGLYDIDIAHPEGDERDYVYDSEIILEQGPLMMGPIDFKTFVGPGYPWLLALSKWIGGETAIVWINALLAALTVLLIFRIGRLFMQTPWAEFAAIWAILYVPYTLYVGTLLKESLLQFLVIWSFYLVFKLRIRFTLKLAVLFAFALTYLVHTDERYLFFFPVYILTFIYHKATIVQKLKRVGAIIGFFILLCLPWTIRNYIVFERPIFLTERLHMPLDKILGIPNDLAQQSVDYSTDLGIFRDSLLAGLNPKVETGRQKGIAWSIDNGLVPHDFTLWEKIFYNSYAYWSPIRTKDILVADGWKFWPARGPFGNTIYMLNFGILLPFFLIGVFLAWRNRVFELKMLTLYLFLHYALHILMISGSGRYRHPIDFIILLLAFYGGSRVWLTIQEKRASVRQDQNSKSPVD